MSTLNKEGKEGRPELPVASLETSRLSSIHPRNFSQKCDSVVVVVVVLTKGDGRGDVDDHEGKNSYSLRLK